MANFCDKIRVLREDTTNGKCVTIVLEDEMMAICSSEKIEMGLMANSNR